MTEIFVEPDWGPVRAIDMASLVPGNRVISGPARLMGWSVRDGSGAVNLADSEQDLPATAGFTLGTVTLTGDGKYDVNWEVGFNPAPLVTDAFNVQLLQNAAVLLTCRCSVAAGQYPQTSLKVTGRKNDVLTIVPIVNGGAGITYFGSISAGISDTSESVVELRDGNQALAEMKSPTAGAASVWLGPQGILIANQITAVNILGALSGSIFVQYYRGD